VGGEHPGAGRAESGCGTGDKGNLRHRDSPLSQLHCKRARSSKRFESSPRPVAEVGRRRRWPLGL